MSIQAMVAATVSRYGRLDILVNNAGIPGEQAPTAESSIDNWRRVMAVNLDGVYFGMTLRSLPASFYQLMGATRPNRRLGIRYKKPDDISAVQASMIGSLDPEQKLHSVRLLQLI